MFRIIFLLSLALILTWFSPVFSLDPFTMPDKMDIETWLLQDHRLTTTTEEDEDSILFEDSVRFVDLDNNNKYEIVLMAELPLDRPDKIPPERSFLYIYKKFGSTYDRVHFHDAGEGRFKHLAFPDFDKDGTKEILFSISSKYTLDFNRFEIHRKGGYFYRPFFKKDAKIYMISDLNGDGKLDIITTHRYEKERFYLFKDWKFVEVDFKDLKDYLLSERFKLYKHLSERIKKKKKELEEE